MYSETAKVTGDHLAKIPTKAEGTWGFIGILHHNWAKIALRWKKRQTQTSQRGFKSIPRAAFVNMETGELKKKQKKQQQTNRETVTGVSPSASHVWSSITAEAPALKPSWSKRQPPIRTTYQIWAEMGTRRETKHRRDTAEHTGQDAAVCLHLKDRRNSCGDGTVHTWYREGRGRQGALTPMLQEQFYCSTKAINMPC